MSNGQPPFVGKSAIHLQNIESSKHLQPLLSRSNIHAVKLDMTDIKSLEIEYCRRGGQSHWWNFGCVDYQCRYHYSRQAVQGLVRSIHSAILAPLTDFYSIYEELVKEQSLFDTNVLGPVCTIKAFLPLVLKGEQKKIIAISSGNADIDFTLTFGAGMGATYTATKAALNAYISKLPVQYRKDGVIFRSVSPGMMDVGATQDPPVTDNTALYAPMVKQLKPLYPDLEGPSNPEQSVDQMLQLIDNTTIDDSGTFVSHHGNKRWL